MTEPDFPAMPFYPRDWLSGGATTVMTPEQRGGFMQLLAHSWLTKEPPCTLPDNDDELASLSGLGAKKWKAVGALIRRQFQPAGEGRIRNPKLHSVYIEMLAHRESRARAGAKGAERRWQSHNSATPPPTTRHPDANGKPGGTKWPSSSSAVTIVAGGQRRRPSWRTMTGTRC